MKVKDKNINEIVDVRESECLNRPCYWPRPDPGIFTPGCGYRARGQQPSSEYICGNRDIHGCPDVYSHKGV